MVAVRRQVRHRPRGRLLRDILAFREANRDLIARDFPPHWRRSTGYSLNELLKPDGEFNPARLLVSSEGTLAVSRGDHDAARRSFEDALDLLAASEARFEAGRVRLDLAATLSALGHRDRARREIEAALAGFQELGASGESARAEAMLQSLHKTRATLPPEVVDTPLGELSKRELEVLGLVETVLTCLRRDGP